jgi:hypothetical protein
MFTMDLHEEFPAPWQACGGSSGWTDAIPQVGGNGLPGWGSWVTAFDGTFPDTIVIWCPPGRCSPAPACPASDCTGATTVGTSTVANASAAQNIVVGSGSLSPLGKYVAATPNIQVVYTDNGRDQPSTWTCPAH